MNKRATAKQGRAIRHAKAVRRARNGARRADAERFLSLDNPPTGATMSVDDLAELADMGRNQAYAAVRQGIYPSIRVGEKGKIAVLVQPTLQILRGERPPGEPGKKLGDDRALMRRLRGESQPAAT
jgi:hypothetical protein